QEHSVLPGKLCFEISQEAVLTALWHDETELIEATVTPSERETELRQNWKVVHIGSPDLDGSVNHFAPGSRHQSGRNYTLSTLSLKRVLQGKVGSVEHGGEPTVGSGPQRVACFATIIIFKYPPVAHARTPSL